MASKRHPDQTDPRPGWAGGQPAGLVEGAVAGLKGAGEGDLAEQAGAATMSPARNTPSPRSTLGRSGEDPGGEHDPGPEDVALLRGRPAQPALQHRRSVAVSVTVNGLGRLTSG